MRTYFAAISLVLFASLGVQARSHCSALVKAPHVSGHPSLEFFQNSLMRMEDALKDVAGPDDLSLKTLKKIHRDINKLMVVSQVYQKIYGHPFGHIYKTVQKLKWAVGDYKDTTYRLKKTNEVLESLSENHLHKELLLRYQSRLRNQKINSKEALFHRLENDGWLESSKKQARLPALRLKLNEVNWLSVQQEWPQWKIFSRLRLQKISKMPYDLTDLLNGVHDLRKDVRKIVLLDEVAGSLVADQNLIDRQAYFVLAQSVDDLEEIKDAGEMGESLYGFLIEEKMSKKEARLLAESIVQTVYNFSELQLKLKVIVRDIDSVL